MLNLSRHFRVAVIRSERLCNVFQSEMLVLYINRQLRVILMIFTDLAIALSTCDDAFMRSRSALTILRRILAEFVDPFSPTTPCGFDAGFAARRVIPP